MDRETTNHPKIQTRKIDIFGIYIYILAATPALGGPLAGQGAKPPGHPAPNLAPQPLSTSALTLHPVFAFLAP